MKKVLSCLSLLLAAVLLFAGGRVEAAPGLDWNNRVITATGMGVPTLGTVGAQARMLARRAAVADAYRQLAETISGVNVDAETTVEMMAVKSDVVRTKVSAAIRGAVIVAENTTPDGGYEVTMQVPMFGVSGLSTAVFEPITPKDFPKPAPEVIPSMPADSQIGDTNIYQKVDGGSRSPMAAIGGYTGVVIDCRGLNLNPVMSPVIKNENGVKLYGHENLNYDIVIRDGMASYANDMSQAQRAGAKPLILKAVRLDDHNANPVVSVADGNRLLIENGASSFLNNTAVVFLY